MGLERGLVPPAPPPAKKTHVKIQSLVTGALYAADVLTAVSDNKQALVQYRGTYSVPNVPRPAAPVVITTYNVAGSQVGSLLPTGRAIDRFSLGAGLGEANATLIDFARALVVLDASDVLPVFGYESIAAATKQR